MAAQQHPTEAELSADPALADWRVILGRLQARFITGDFSRGARFAGRVAEVADRLDHHPDLDLRYPHVTVSTVSHDVGRLTGRDRALAVEISALAAEMDLHPRPEQVSDLEIGLDVQDHEAVAPFWAAVLGYAPSSDGTAVTDPAGRHAALWFQHTERPRTERGRFHLDITVPHQVAQARVEAALAAGGVLVTAEFAPAWWVLADAEGNEVCVCTWQGRDGDG
jgi:4a-hydroxytetrahydrobiopterin dehydratase